MEQFRGQNILNFIKELPTDNVCKAIWQKLNGKMVLLVINVDTPKVMLKLDTYLCYCFHHVESATANTLFHKVKFGLQKSIFYCLRNEH